MHPSAFLAFRSAAFALLRPTGARALLFRECPRALFHSAPITYKKNELALPDRKKVVVPPHNPTPKPLRGKKIGIPQVHLLDPETNKIGHLRSLDELVDSLNPEEYLVELVERYPPTVKLVDVKALRAATVEQRLKEKPIVGKEVLKEIVMTWAMAEADEKHKMSQIRGYLERGMRVDIAIQTRKTQVPPSPSEVAEKVEALISSLADVSKEWKTRQVTRRRALLFLQSKMAKANKMDLEILKESVPKTVQERKLRAEKAKERQEKNRIEQPLDTYNDLWGI